MADARAPQRVRIDVHGQPVVWDMANEPKPDSVGNGSRNGFLYNCYTHPMGRFFQETIKRGLETIIRRIHDKEIPRYDKQAYTYDDPRLKAIDKLLKGMMVKHIDDNDTIRKHAIFGAFIDIICFMMKEDVFYRARIIKALDDLAEARIAHPEIFDLTPEELYNYEKFNGMMRNIGSVGCYPGAQPITSYPSFEEWVKDPESAKRWEAAHRRPKEVLG